MDFLAVASAKSYLFDLFIWAIIAAVVFIFLRAFFKRNQIFVRIFGALVFLSAFPAAFMSEMSINGCCGAPSGSYRGAGYLIGAIIAVAGVLIFAFSKRISKK
jgi:hypothetical protein